MPTLTFKTLYVFSHNPVPRGTATRRPTAGRPGRWTSPLIRTPRTLPRVLAPADVDRFVAALRTQRDRAMVEAMLLGGLRRCEVLGVCLTDVSPGEHRLFIAAGKGGHQRHVPVSKRFFVTLAEYLATERPPTPNEVVLIDELKKLGVEAYPVNADPTVMCSSWADGSFMYRGDFDILYWDSGPGMPDPQRVSLNLYSSKSIPTESRLNGQNMSRINDPEIDRWLAEAGSTLDLNARRAAYCKVEDKVLNTWVTEQYNGIIPNFQYSQPQVQGWTDNELSTPFGQDAENWYLVP